MINFKCVGCWFDSSPSFHTLAPQFGGLFRSLVKPHLWGVLPHPTGSDGGFPPVRGVFGLAISSSNGGFPPTGGDSLKMPLFWGVSPRQEYHPTLWGGR